MGTVNSGNRKHSGGSVEGEVGVEYSEVSLTAEISRVGNGAAARCASEIVETKGIRSVSNSVRLGCYKANRRTYSGREGTDGKSNSAGVISYRAC